MQIQTGRNTSTIESDIRNLLNSDRRKNRTEISLKELLQELKNRCGMELSKETLKNYFMENLDNKTKNERIRRIIKKENIKIRDELKIIEQYTAHKKNVRVFDFNNVDIFGNIRAFKNVEVMTGCKEIKGIYFSVLEV